MEDFTLAEKTRWHHVPMAREPRLGDILAVIKSALLLKRLRPQTIVCGTPKASLIVLLAGCLVRVPNRTYVLHGLRLEGAQGIARVLLWILEAITLASATQVIPVSDSLKQAVQRNRLPRTRNLHSIGSGSANGVDTFRFKPADRESIEDQRRAYGISDDAFVAGFVGRISHDKGVPMMTDVFRRLLDRYSNLYLVLVGPEEVNHPAHREELDKLLSLPRVIQMPFQENIEKIYQILDVAILFTRREGLPTMVLEAAACGVPTIATNATGTVDAILHGKTGLLVPQGNTHAAIEAVVSILDNEVVRKQMSENARVFVEEKYERQQVVACWCEFILSLP